MPKFHRSPAERRAHKFKVQGGLCYWCKGPMTLDYPAHKPGSPPRNFATFEHLQRRRDGGVGKPFNVVLACKSCNNGRDAGVQTSKPKPENVVAKRMSDAELVAGAQAGTLNVAASGEFFTRGLGPNWPMWTKIMGQVPMGNP